MDYLEEVFQKAVEKNYGSRLWYFLFWEVANIEEERKRAHHYRNAHKKVPG